MRRFLLRDDVEMVGRWTLSDPMTDQGCDSFIFRRGKAVYIGEPVIEVQIPGLPLDFSMTVLDVPIATAKLAQRIATVAGSDVQRVPVLLRGQEGHEALNALRVVRCLDESRSEFIKWTEPDNRPDKV